MTIQELKKEVALLIKQYKYDEAIEKLEAFAKERNDSSLLGYLKELKKEWLILKKKPKTNSGFKNPYQKMADALSDINAGISEPKSAKPPRKSVDTGNIDTDLEPKSSGETPHNIPSSSIPPPKPAAATAAHAPTPRPMPTPSPLQGSLLYNIPDEMPQNVDTECVVRIATDKTLLMKPDDNFSKPVIKDIRIGKLMMVELLELGRNAAFEITPTITEPQPIEATTAAEWLFFVKPLKVGKFKLMLRVSIVERIDGVDRFKQDVLVQNVTVTAEAVISNNNPQMFMPDYKEQTNAADDTPSVLGIKNILFMGANPPDTRHIDLNKEQNKIAAELNHAFNLVTDMDLSVSEISKLMVANNPHIIHFSGHGKDPNSGEHGKEGRALGLPKSYKKTGGIVLFSKDMTHLTVIEDALLERVFQDVVQGMHIPIKIAVFNSCFSESQAKILSKYVPYVVGTSNAIADDLAIGFAEGFYFGIAKNKSIKDAFLNGRVLAATVTQNQAAFDLMVLYKNGQRLDL